MTKYIGEDIRQCLQMFGACNAEKIQDKLKLRGLEVTLDHIDRDAEDMVKHRLIFVASGYRIRTYRI